MTGTITRVFRDRGYAFLRDVDGQNRFLHRRSLRPENAFDALFEGQQVEFEPTGQGENSLRAINATVLDGNGRESRAS